MEDDNILEEGFMLEDFENKQAKYNEEQLREKINLSNKYKYAFKEGLGNDVLNDLEDKFLNHPSYLPGWNLNDTCYLEGQKSVIKHIKRQIEYKYDN